MQAQDANSRRVSLAGALLFISGVWGLFSITIAESLTPGYNVSSGTVSGLGTPYLSGVCNTLPRCAAPIQPASAVIVFSFFLGGILMIWSGYLLRRATSHKLFGLGLLVAGVLLLLIVVSYIPFYLGASTAGAVGAAYDLHVASSFPVFILAIILMIFTYRFTRGPFRYFSLALGLVALAALGIFLGSMSGLGNYLGLGVGGIERVLIYSFEVWSIGFGAYLLGGFGLD
jgi:hypothetical membrane protein